jgi:gluconolactonase
MPISLTVYKEEIFNFINKDFRIEVLSDDCRFTEGPVWNQNDQYYLFSDITANCIYKISENETKQLYISNSGTNNMMDPDLKSDQSGSNGLAYDNHGNLLICRHGSHDVALYDGDKIISLIDSCRGKPFNSPNDIVIHKDGTIYFSDPPYGLKNGKLFPGKYQGRAGVYAFRHNQLTLISDKYQYPNGVCLSLDQALLYVGSNKPNEKFISIYDTGSFEFKGIFAEENSDGIKMDKHGNLILCSNEGIIFLNKQGERMALIRLAAIPANACWGGKDMNDLIVTARENVYLIKGLSLSS